MRLSTSIFFLASVLFSVSGAIAQTPVAGELQWTRIKDDAGNISILFPSDYIVDNEAETYSSLASSDPDPKFVEVETTDKPKIYGSRKGIRMNLTVREFPHGADARKYLFYLLNQDEPKDNYQNFQIGEFAGRKTVRDSDKTHSFYLTIAAKNKAFFIYAVANMDNEQIYQKLIHSLLLNGKPLFKNAASEPAENSPTILVSSLKTSQEIADALQQKTDTSESKIIKDAPPQDGETEVNIYSRPIYALRVPREENVGENGMVKLKVTFLANGKIGDIYILSKSSNALTNSAVKAAKKIKFLPAEIDGKKVDSLKQVNYSFSGNH